MKWPGPDRWQALLRAAGVSQPVSDWYHRLTAAYGEPHRHYHTDRHVAECLAEFARAQGLVRHPVAVELALWFHDAVYDPKAGDNEVRSAALAGECLDACGLPASLVEKLARFILATRHHEPGADIDAAVTVDVDLSILGKDQGRFSEYEAQIGREYTWVPRAVFCTKRVELLDRFLARSHIFATKYSRSRCERLARQNLKRSINRLRAERRGLE